jgi:hypothetical protein
VSAITIRKGADGDVRNRHDPSSSLVDLDFHGNLGSARWSHAVEVYVALVVGAHFASRAFIFDSSRTVHSIMGWAFHASRALDLATTLDSPATRITLIPRVAVESRIWICARPSEDMVFASARSFHNPSNDRDKNVVVDSVVVDPDRIVVVGIFTILIVFGSIFKFFSNVEVVGKRSHDEGKERESVSKLLLDRDELSFVILCSQSSESRSSSENACSCESRYLKMLVAVNHDIVFVISDMITIEHKWFC